MPREMRIVQLAPGSDGATLDHSIIFAELSQRLPASYRVGDLLDAEPGNFQIVELPCVSPLFVRVAPSSLTDVQFEAQLTQQRRRA